MDLFGRSFLTLLDYTPEEIEYLLELSAKFKRMKKDGEVHRYLEGKNIVLLFEKTSTRTRCAFETAASDLGMGVTFLDQKSSQMGKKESLRDTACVLGGMYDGIEYRGFEQKVVEELAKYAGVPVWNGLTDDYHPTQMLADILTVQEEFGDVKNRKLVFMGDARNNVANSLMIICSKLGMHYVACGPEHLMPKDELVERCQKIAKDTGAKIELLSDPKEACTDADVIYTDIWLSMGENPDLWEERIKLLQPYQVNEELFSYTKPEAIFMHCLPSFHDRNTEMGEEIYQKYGLESMEVADDVFYGERSRVFREAENRQHSIKAVMYATLERKEI